MSDIFFVAVLNRYLKL